MNVLMKDLLMGKKKKQTQDLKVALETDLYQPSPILDDLSPQSEDRPPKLDRKFYEKELARLQIELVKMQYWIKHTGYRLVILFEGRDAAGKGGTIKRITEPLNPRGCKVVALGTPSDQQKSQWYFQRYVEHFPSAGEIVLWVPRIIGIHWHRTTLKMPPQKRHIMHRLTPIPFDLQANC